jgi:CRP-like cAMP-binding protein
MPIANHGSISNNLLEALPRKDYQKILTRMEPVLLTLGEVLYNPSEPIRYVYFPINSMVSLLTSVEGHQPIEVGMVGHEGMLGIPLALGVKYSPVQALVQGSGMSMRMSAANFMNEFNQCILLQREVYRYIYELMVQISQSAACNRFHRVESRLARWLLMTRDRLLSNQFHLTQSLLSDMLGVRRVGVTQAAGILRQRKLISYTRGEICILDSDGLEAAACPCYQIVKKIHSDTRIQPPPKSH